MTTHNFIIKVFPDGNQWCALIENPPTLDEPEFADTAAEAVEKLSRRLYLPDKEGLERQQRLKEERLGETKTPNFDAIYTAVGETASTFVKILSALSDRVEERLARSGVTVEDLRCWKRGDRS